LFTGYTSFEQEKKAQIIIKKTVRRKSDLPFNCIIMISKNEAKYIQSLYQKKTRLSEALFIAEGAKLVDEILQSNFVVRKIYAVGEWIKYNNENNVTEVSADELQRISNLQTPNQVLAIVEQRTMIDEPGLKNTITLVLDGIQDPGNLGTIIRIADWFGIKQIVAGEDTVDLYNPKVVQSTMGSIIRVNVWYKQLDAWLDKVGVPVYGALLNGENVLKHDAIKEGIIVIGNESKGIRSNIMPFIKHALTIPRFGEAESLNAAVATGIILSHVV
jgi:TrmH family RNA methyltransferase